MRLSLFGEYRYSTVLVLYNIVLALTVLYLTTVKSIGYVQYIQCLIRATVLYWKIDNSNTRSGGKGWLTEVSGSPIKNIKLQYGSTVLR